MADAENMLDRTQARAGLGSAGAQWPECCAQQVWAQVAGWQNGTQVTATARNRTINRAMSEKPRITPS
jgi:hypothetical protein